MNLKGLNGGEKEECADLTKPLQETIFPKPNSKSSERQTKMDDQKLLVPDLQIDDMEIIEMVLPLIPPKQMFSGNLQELDAKLDSMMTRGEYIIPA